MNNFNLTVYERDGDCHIVVEGRFDATNDAEVAAKAFALRKEHPKGALVFHAQKLEYVSSAGLRVLLKLQKSEQERIRITNCSDGLFEILSVTGFTEILNVTKDIEEIDTEGLEIIGRGAAGTVYRLGPDQIVKMYAPEYKLNDIEAERMAARTAFIKQIPTAIPFKTVKSGDRYGLVFEMLNAVTLTHKFATEPDRLEEYMERFVALGRQLHSQTLPEGEFPSMKESFRKAIKAAGKFFSVEEQEMILQVLDSIPDSNTMLHGDLHPGNIMVDGNDELIFIDMGGIGYGHPIFDVIDMLLLYPIPLITAPEFILNYHKLSEEMINKVWKCYLSVQFRGASEEELDTYEKILKGFAALRMVPIGVSVFAPTLPAEFIRGTTELGMEYIRENIDDLLATDWDKLDEYIAGK